MRKDTSLPKKTQQSDVPRRAISCARIVVCLPGRGASLRRTLRGFTTLTKVNAVNIGFRDAYEITDLIDLPLIQDFEFVTRGLFAA